MAKRKRNYKTKEAEDSSEGEMDSSPKRRKAKREPKASKSKLGKGKKGDEEKETDSSDKKPVTFDPSVPYNVSMSSLNPLICCSLCNGYLVDATTVVECLHSFCKSCILKYFEDEDNCCPKCGQLIHQSHPTHYIAFDRTLQDMVYKLVPGLFDAELEQRDTFVKEAKRKAGEDIEEEAKKLEERKKEQEADRTNRCFEGKLKISHHRNEQAMKIELIRGVPDLPVIKKRIVRTSEMCTVTTLKRYLSYSMYGTKEKHMEMDLFCNNELMGRDFSMKFILLTRCRKKPMGQPLKLVYKHRIDL